MFFFHLPSPASPVVLGVTPQAMALAVFFRFFYVTVFLLLCCICSQFSFFAGFAGSFSDWIASTGFSLPPHHQSRAVLRLPSNRKSV